MESLSKAAMDAAAITGTVGALAGIVAGVGIVTENDPWAVPRDYPAIAGNFFNVCDPLNEDAKNTITASLQEGRNDPYKTRPHLNLPKELDERLAGVLSTPDLDQAKKLLNGITTEEFGFTTTYADTDKRLADKDVRNFAYTLRAIPPALVKAALLETVELGSSTPGKGDTPKKTVLGRYNIYEGKITLRPGKAGAIFPHELGHAVVAASTAEHCWFPSTDDEEVAAANPPGVAYDDEAYYDHAIEAKIKNYKKYFLTDYGTIGSGEDAADIVGVVQDADPEADREIQCAYKRSPVIDDKIVKSLTRIEELAPGVGKDYAHKLGAQSVMAYCAPVYARK